MEITNNKTHISQEWIILGLFSALWICSRPYYGIWHDALLYTGQALHLIMPENFSRDLFFIHTSQDKYTLFSNIYAFAITHLGLNTASGILCILGQIVWFTGAIYFTRRLFHPPLSWIALAAIIILPIYYSENNIFRAGENFLTPRLFAEGLSLYALATLLDKKYLTSGVLVIVAATLHPLNTLPALLLLYFCIAKIYPKSSVIFTLVSITTVLLLAVADIPPANGLFLPIDPEWYAITSARSPWLYTETWSSNYWNVIALTVSILTTAVFRTTGRLAYISQAGLFVTSCGISVAYIASETLFSVLLIQLQTWRVLWLGLIIASCAGVRLVYDSINGKIQPEIIIGYLAAIFYIETYGGIIALLIAIYSALPESRTVKIRKYVIALTIALFVMGSIELLLLKGNYFARTIPVTLTHPNTVSLHTPLYFTIGLTFWFIFSRHRYKHPDTTTFFPVAVVLFLSITIWDQRGDSILWRDVDTEQLAVLHKLIKQDETVFWQDNSAMPTWLLLRRSSYYSRTQTSGVVFNRNTAVEASNRYNALLPLYIQQEYPELAIKPLLPKTVPEMTISDVRSVCGDTDLDWLVLSEELQNVRTTYTNADGNTWYFYKCSDFRSNFTAGRTT